MTWDSYFLCIHDVKKDLDIIRTASNDVTDVTEKKNGKKKNPCKDHGGGRICEKVAQTILIFD